MRRIAIVGVLMTFSYLMGLLAGLLHEPAGIWLITVGVLVLSFVSAAILSETEGP